MISIRLLAGAMVLLATLPASAEEQPEAPRRIAITASVIIKVVHVVEVRQKLLAEVEQMQGFHTLVSDQSMRVKVPPDKLLEALRKFGEHGLVVEKTINRKDLTQQIAQLEGLLRSKEDIFARLEKLVDDSDLASTLNIERTMGSLVGEIEQTKGRLRVERERAEWAVIDLSFRFRKRENITYVKSPFEWLNSVDLSRFVTGF